MPAINGKVPRLHSTSKGSTFIDEHGGRFEFACHDDFMQFMRRRIAAHDAAKGIAPAIRPDAIEMVSPLTGKVVTSKSAYYREVRQAGCEINPEAGIKDRNRPRFRSEGLAQDIRRAIEQGT